MAMATKTKNTEAKSARADLLSIATQLGIADVEVMSTKALKRAIKEAQAEEPAEPLGLPAGPAEIEAIIAEIEAIEVAPPAEAPVAEAPPTTPPAKPAKVKRQPLDETQVNAAVERGLATYGQVEGAPQAGGPWHSPHGRDHIVIGSYEKGGFVYVCTVRTTDGRQFAARHKRIVKDIAKQAGTASTTVAPSAA